MSIYDKYFSERNKTHMFSLVRDIIVREVAHDINHDPPYQDLFHGQYVRVFEETQGETLVDCNRDVIDRICPLIIEDIQRKRGGTTDSEAIMTTEKTTVTREVSSGTRDLHEERFSYIVGSNPISGVLRKLIIPEEENALFGHPVIHVSFRPETSKDADSDETSRDMDHLFVCELSESIVLGGRTYHTYLCDSQRYLPDHTSYRCTLQNSEGLTPILHARATDTCAVISLKHIHPSQSYLCLQLTEIPRSFRVRDTLCLCTSETSIGTTRILDIKGPYLLCQTLPPALYDECQRAPIHVRNSSLQHTLVFDI